MKETSKFSSSFGTIVVIGGSVVGLGNIWRFPYIAGENGGGAFIAVYILTTLFIAVPLILCELSLGRKTQSDVFTAFVKMKSHKAWRLVGGISIFSALFIMSFYSVVAGWSFEFMIKSLSGDFVLSSATNVKSQLDSFVNTGYMPVAWALVYIGVTGGIVMMGVKRGIERLSKIMMPIFFVIILGLAIHSMTLPGVSEGLDFLFNPDFSKIDGSVILTAVGQAFFSLSIGLGAMVTYGAYVNNKANLKKLTLTIVLTDTLVAILAGLIIFPAIFTHGIDSSSGPELIYVTLPTVFGQMPGGMFISGLFFFLVFLAAITSSISLLELNVAFLINRTKLSRKKAVVLTSAVSALLATLCSLSLMDDSIYTIAGVPVFDFLDYITATYMLPISSIGFVLFMGWVANKTLREEILNYNINAPWWYRSFNFSVKYVLPIVLLLILING